MVAAGSSTVISKDGKKLHVPVYGTLASSAIAACFAEVRLCSFSVKCSTMCFGYDRMVFTEFY